MADFVKQKYVKYHLGDRKIRAHIDALHAQPPKSDRHTGQIVEGVVDRINCSGIIAIVSRTIADLNRQRDTRNAEAIDEYRQTIHKILTHIGNFEEDGRLLSPYLHLSIHGMKNKWGEDIDIGTRHGATCSADVKQWFIDQINLQIERVQVDGIFPGNDSKSVHRLGDQSSNDAYRGHGLDFNTFQVEISANLRENNRAELVEILSNTIILFQKEFG